MKKRKISNQEPRYSLSTMEIESSAASEMEIEELTTQVLWERQRAERAEEMIEFLKAECEMHCCPCSKSKVKSVSGSPEHIKASPAAEPAEELSAEASEELAEEVVEEVIEEPMEPTEPTPAIEVQDEVITEQARPEIDQEMDTPRPASPRRSPSPKLHQIARPMPDLAPPKSKKEPRRSTIFYPKEGIFRTVSEQEAAAMEAQGEPDVRVQHAPAEIESEPPTPVEVETPADARMYARTPSAEPPAYALLAQERTSLLSLLDAPHNQAHNGPVPSIPMVSDTVDDRVCNDQQVEDNRHSEPRPQPVEPRESPEPRPHTSATLYTMTTTTTVPVRDENSQRESSSSFGEKLRTPSSGSNASFDLNNPALTPTMTREQALAKIRERRGRAKSAAQGAATPHKKMIQGKDRRDLSAPTSKARGSSNRSRS